MNQDHPINDEYCLARAKQVALESPDPSTQLGAVIARDNVILGEGFNGPVVKVEDWMLKRENKYHFFIHAEQAAILSALANQALSPTGHDGLIGATLYLSKWLPCSECAKQIVKAGITRIVTTDSRVPPRWKESINCSLHMFIQAEIQLQELTF